MNLNRLLITIFIVLLIIISAEAGYYFYFNVKNGQNFVSYQQSGSQINVPSIAIQNSQPRQGNLLKNLPEKWKSLMKKVEYKYVFEGRAEKIILDSKEEDENVPLSIFFNVQTNTKYAIGDSNPNDWSKTKIYIQDNESLLPYNYKLLKTGDILEITMIYQENNRGESTLKSITIIKKGS